MPKTDSGASALAPLLDGSTAGELIPELVRFRSEALQRSECSRDLVYSF
jgi:hypothetical protein